MNKLMISLVNKARQIYSNKSASSSSTSSLMLQENDFTEYDYQEEQAGDYIKKILSQNEPCMICRFGSTEFGAFLTYLNIIDDSNYISKSIRYIKGEAGWFWWDNLTKFDMGMNSGFFPATEPFLKKFGERYVDDIKNIDVLGSWLVDEKRIKETFFPKAVRVPLIDLEPFYHQNPWSEILREKTVLVIHPFDESIHNQYTKRKVIFKDDRVLPDFELKTIKAVQSIAENPVNFLNWFEALDYMCDQIANTKFDVAIIGAGAYGLPLASFVKRLGNKSVHLGGATQLLFGIKGKRWEDRPFYKNLFNEHWVRPLPSEMASNVQKTTDKGAYW
jgi:hypothetical protein